MKYLEMDELGALIDLTDRLDNTSTLTNLMARYEVGEYEPGVHLGFSIITGQLERVVIEDDSKSLDEVLDIIGQAMLDRDTDMEDSDD